MPCLYLCVCVYIYVCVCVCVCVYTCIYTCMWLQCGIPGFDPWVEKVPWRRIWKPTLVLLPGKFHGQGSLVGYSSWGRKESDMTEQLHFSFIHRKSQFCQLLYFNL